MTLEPALFRWSSSWRRGRLPWAVLCLVVVVAVGVIVVGATQLERSTNANQRLQQELDAAAAPSELQRPESSAIVSLAEPDFARALGREVPAEPLVAELQRACTTAGVVLGTVAVQFHPATREQLARSEISVSLRGVYPGIKQVLSDVLARYPDATLRRMNLRLLSSSTEVEATLVLSLWGRPLEGEPVADAKGR